jgi:hypothetical protein
MAQNPGKFGRDVLEGAHLTTSLLNPLYGTASGLYEAGHGYWKGGYSGKEALFMAGMEFMPWKKGVTLFQKGGSKLKEAILRAERLEIPPLTDKARNAMRGIKESDPHQVSKMAQHVWISRFNELRKQQAREAKKIGKIQNKVHEQSNIIHPLKRGHGSESDTIKGLDLADFGQSNINAKIALNKKMSALQDAQKTAAKTVNFPDGRIRYYEAERTAKTEGITRGSSYVTEYNPKTGQVKSWMESYDHKGQINRVHPKMLNGQKLKSLHFPLTGKEIETLSKVEQ